MLLALALLALGFEGDEAPPGPEWNEEVISFHTRIVEVEGLRWREALHAQLKPVARRGGATVWTADRAIEPLLKEHVFDDSSAHVFTTPRVPTAPETEVRIENGTFQDFSTRVQKVAQGQPDSLGVRVDRRIRQGESLALSGRRLDQGILARVAITDTRVTAIHEVETREEVSGPEPATFVSWEQVPEVVEARVEGEWLIPADGLLVVSLGPHTLTVEGEPVVRERLVVIEADTALPDPATPADSVMRTSYEDASPAQSRVPIQLPPRLRVAAVLVDAAAQAITEAVTPPEPGTALPMPILPSRTLPGDHPGRPSGESADDLPPLPDDEAHPASAEDFSAEPRPSPQAKHIRPDLPPAPPSEEDPSVEKTSAAPVPPCPITEARIDSFRLPIVGTRGIQVPASVSHTRRPTATK